MSTPVKFDAESKALVVYEKPEMTHIMIRGNYGVDKQWTSLMPYSNFDWKTTAERLGVEIPFKEFTGLHEGKAICKKCNAVYSGYQGLCTAEVRLVSYRDIVNSWYAYSKHSENLAVGQRFTEDRSSYIVTEAKTGFCHGELSWDKKEEFDRQKAFVDLMEIIRGLENNDPLFGEFGGLFTEDQKIQIRFNYLLNIVKNERLQLNQHAGALRMIAEKMNNAGAALSFGF